MTGSLLATALAASIASAPPAEAAALDRCHVVHGRYAIYADKDLLQVAGSRHRLVVVLPALDAELNRRGWEKTFAEGSFRLCAERPVDPRALTIRDRVRVIAYRGIRFVTQRRAGA